MPGMRPETGLPKYPSQRMIVFAGVNNQPAKLVAVTQRRPIAIMASFELMKSKSGKLRDHTEYFSWLDQWPHYRYLDSGAFTIMAKSGAVKKSGKTNAVLDAEQREGPQRKLAYLQDAVDHLRLYLGYLEQELDRWDFIFDCDLDPVELITPSGSIMPGYEFTVWAREKILAVAGDKLIPVWHVVSDDPTKQFPKFRALVEDYSYVAVGSSSGALHRYLRYICDAAHARGVLVHGLGTSKVDVLGRTPFDTVDSTTWLSGGKFGLYAGIAYRKSSKMNMRQIRRARAFEDTVRALGYDPAVLIAEKPDAAVQFAVALALLQEREAAAPPIPEPLAFPELELTDEDEGSSGLHLDL